MLGKGKGKRHIEGRKVRSQAPNYGEQHSRNCVCRTCRRLRARREARP
jgi:hypothetical protein